MSDLIDLSYCKDIIDKAKEYGLNYCKDIIDKANEYEVMTDEQKLELHDLLDTLVYAQLSVQPCKREKALETVEKFVDRVAAYEVALATATTYMQLELAR